MRPRTNSVMSAGASVTDASAANAIANVFVNASGLNSRPAWPLSAKIGRNAAVMMSSEKKIGGPTSCAASISNFCREAPGGADRDRDAAQAHDVRIDAEEVHGDEGEPDRDRQRQHRDQRAAQMEQEDED